MPIEGCELDNPVCSFGWAAELKRHFRFRASTVHFWKVGYLSVSVILSLTQTSYSAENDIIDGGH